MVRQTDDSNANPLWFFAALIKKIIGCMLLCKNKLANNPLIQTFPKKSNIDCYTNATDYSAFKNNSLSKNVIK